MSDDELFGNDDEFDKMEDDFNPENGNENKQTQEDSDIDPDDLYGDKDFFGKNNLAFQKTTAFSIIDPPSDGRLQNPFFQNKANTNVNLNSTNPEQPVASTFFQHRYHAEKVIALDNSDNDKNTSEFEKLNTSQTINSYIISYSMKFEPMLSKYDVFSKRHHREKLFSLINKLDWDNQMKINNFKREINPYEEVFEKFFQRNSAYKLANLNYIFNFRLIGENYVLGYTPILCVGDDGGFTDYILWYSNQNNVNTKVIVIPEKEMKYEKAKFREEIHEIKEEKTKLLNYGNGFDIDEIRDMSSYKLKLITQEILEETDEMGLSLFIAKKNIKFSKEFSQEIQYKKFLLTNLILAFSTLTREGNLIIKIYDMYTPFTISVLYILYSHFEKFIIIKPFSTRPHTNSKYIICHRFLENKPKILDYLYEFYDKYISLIKEGKDCEFIFPTSKILRDEPFINYIMEMNTNMTEKRIESLEDLRNAIEMNKVPKFDKMDLKKKCLDLWKVPVLNYDPKLLLSNKFKRPETTLISMDKASNKPKTLKETAHIYSDYDKNSEGMQGLLDSIIGNSKPKNVIKFDERKNKNDKLKELDDILYSDMSKNDKGLESLFGKKYNSKKNAKDKSDKDKKDRYSYYSYEDSNDRNKKSSSYNDSRSRSNRDLDVSQIHKKPAERKEYRNEKELDYIKESKSDFLGKKRESGKSEIKSNLFNSDKEFLSKPIGNVNKEKIVEETMKNRILMENQKITLTDDMKAMLEQFKKKN